MSQMRYKENEGYIFEDYEDDHVAIILTHGPFEGVKYIYTKVSSQEIDDKCMLHIGFDVISPGIHELEKLSVDSDFHNILGAVLEDIVLNNSSISENI